MARTSGDRSPVRRSVHRGNCYNYMPATRCLECPCDAVCSNLDAPGCCTGVVRGVTTPICLEDFRGQACP